jgi:hypothetical protein
MLFHALVSLRLAVDLFYTEQALRIYDISGKEPALVSTFPVPHTSSYCANSLLYFDNTVYIQDMQDGLVQAVNVSNPATPKLLWVVAVNTTYVVASCGPGKLLT